MSRWLGFSPLRHATLGANTFTGDQTITGALTVTGKGKFGTSAGTNQLEVGNNQNATTEVSVRNTDATNTTSRAFFRAYCATVTMTMGAIAGNAAYIGSDTNHPLNMVINGTTAATLSTDGAFTVGTTAKSLTGATALWAGVTTVQSITTNTPAGGTSGVWKLGVAAVVSPTAPNRTVELDIGGTIYYLHAKTTNN